MERNDVRLALPSKGILQHGAEDFLEACGLKVYRPNPRQYAATIPGMPGVTVLFQRPGDIVTSVQAGSIDFGITGYDVLSEKGANGGAALVIHDDLGFGACSLNLAVPERSAAQTVDDLRQWAAEAGQAGYPIRIATKFPHVTAAFLDRQAITPYRLIGVEGTLEIAPAIGYADLICDLVSSGITLRDNHLRPLTDGVVLRSQAVLIANRPALRSRPEVLAIAHHLLEYVEAYARGRGSYLIIANMRGDSPEAIAQRMFAQTSLGGLQGPTIAPVVAREHLRAASDWFAVNVVVRREHLFEAVGELRAIGGSGVVVVPCAYIFEEEPVRYRAMLDALAAEQQAATSAAGEGE
ncbi:ATP phosphoribosyltransferase [Candidatus Promineifilum breve]|uniref:ATP phosphoribosyltransferase n=1 Tax=Candidatus Promineifilum breve TaxID=1806508 RepID=A0A160T7V8_9CHLR|nr:ATP phosphoribosyltransferase [Candidatus Promineifilum breve]CUS05448.2 ATP phosphoribosyltransferase [Candidatus Promineifilum breve]